MVIWNLLVEGDLVVKNRFCCAYFLFRRIALLLVFFGITLSSQTAHAAQVTLTWDAPDASIPSGYKVYYGTASRAYIRNVNAGKITKCTVTGLVEGKTYYFAATAYYPGGSESGPSNEAVKYIPIAVADSDGDGLSDSNEINIYRTNPNDPDTDGDGYLDGEEVFDYHTSPLKSDTDGDGIPDGQDPYPNGTGKTEIISDNTDAGFSSGPRAWARSSYVSGYWGKDYQYAVASADEKWAKWTFRLPISGFFEVYARWTAASNRSTAAIYEITDGTSEISAVVDQTKNNGRFVSLGTRWLNAGEVMVKLKNAASGCVVADAVKISAR